MRRSLSKNRQWVKRIIMLAIMMFAGAVLAATSPPQRVSYDKMVATGKTPTLTQVRLDPVRGWLNSGVFLHKGDLVNITASGMIDPGVRLSRGPDGYLQDFLKEMTHECAYTSLLGRVGDSPLFCIGSNATFEVVEGGQLSFHINELDTLRFDDLGSFSIQIRVISLSTPAPTPAPVPAARPLTVVLDLVLINLPKEDAQVLAVALRGHVAATGNYLLVDQTQVDQAIKTLKLKPEELTSVAAAVRIGAALGAEVVVMGQVGKIGDAYSVTLQKVNVKTGAVDSTVVEVISCSRELLPARLADAVKKLL